MMKCFDKTTQVVSLPDFLTGADTNWHFECLKFATGLKFSIAMAMITLWVISL